MHYAAYCRRHRYTYPANITRSIWRWPHPPSTALAHGSRSFLPRRSLRLLDTESLTSTSGAWVKHLPCTCWNPGDGLGSSSESQPSSPHQFEQTGIWVVRGMWIQYLIFTISTRTGSYAHAQKVQMVMEKKQKTLISYVWLRGFNQKVIGLTDGEGEGCLG